MRFDVEPPSSDGGAAIESFSARLVVHEVDGTTAYQDLDPSHFFLRGGGGGGGSVLSGVADAIDKLSLEELRAEMLHVKKCGITMTPFMLDAESSDDEDALRRAVRSAHSEP